MLRFLLRRAILAGLVTLTVLVVAFALTRLSGDLAVSIAGPNATAEDVMTIRKNYGLDRPLPVQFLNWAASAASGDLGRSYLYRAPVSGLIKERLPITLALGLSGLTIALLTAIPLGIVGLALTIGVVGAMLGLAILALKLACVALVGYGVFRLGRAMFASDVPSRPAPVRELMTPDPYYVAAMRELDNEMGRTSGR